MWCYRLLLFAQSRGDRSSVEDVVTAVECSSPTARMSTKASLPGTSARLRLRTGRFPGDALALRSSSALLVSKSSGTESVLINDVEEEQDDSCARSGLRRRPLSEDRSWGRKLFIGSSSSASLSDSLRKRRRLRFMPRDAVVAEYRHAKKCLGRFTAAHELRVL